MTSILLLFLTILSTGLCQPAEGPVWSASSSGALKAALLSNYDRMVAPAEPLMLQYGISPVKIVDMTSKRGFVTVDLWLKQQWVDDRLSWNASLCGVNMLFFTQDTIYVPETELYNGVMTSTTMGDPNIVVYPGGQMIFFPAVRAEVYCNIPENPFHDQICPIIIGPWAHDVRQTELVTFDPAVDHSFVYDTGLSSIGRSTAEITSSSYECCPGLVFDTMTLYLNLSCHDGETSSHSTPTGGQALRQESKSADVDNTDWSYSSLPLIITPFHLLLIFLLPSKSTNRIFLGMMIFVALLLLWTSLVLSSDQERFLVMSLCMTIAATCASLVPCMVSTLHGSTDGGEHTEIKSTVCKTRLGRMVDLMMLAAVAVVLGISAAGVYA